MITERAQRMLDSTPGYYEESRVYIGIQQSIADELDRTAAGTEDLQKQLRATTATWGLYLWEARVGLPVSDGSPIETRRKRVLARIRSKAPFSAAMIKGIVEIYTSNPVKVRFDKENMQVIITMDRETNTSPQLFAAIDNIIHAHLGVEYMAAWEYASEIQYGWSYTAICYPFQAFASQTVYAGTLYGGPAVVNIPPNPVYAGGTIRAAGTFKRTLQEAFKVAGSVYAGNSGVSIPPTVIPKDQAVTYSGGESVSGAYETKQQRAFKITGTTNAGTGELL